MAFGSSRDAGAKAPALTDRVGAATEVQVRGGYNTSTSGIITGGVGTQSSTDPSKILMPEGEGWVYFNEIADDPVQFLLTWPEIDLIDPIDKGGGPLNGISYLWASIPAGHDPTVPDVIAEITQTQPSDYPDPGTIPEKEYLSKVYLGFAVYVPFLGIVIAVISNPRPALNVSANFASWMAGIGGIKVRDAEISGLAGTLSLEMSAGVFLSLGCNWVNDPDIPHTLTQIAISPLLAGQGYRTGLGDGKLATVLGPPTTVLDPTQWDDGSGVLQVVPDHLVTIILVYFNPASPGFIFIFGQHLYQNLYRAHENVGGGPRESIVELKGAGWVKVGAVAVRRDATDLTDSEQALVYRVSQHGAYQLVSEPIPLLIPKKVSADRIIYQGDWFGVDTTASAVTLTIDPEATFFTVFDQAKTWGNATPCWVQTADLSTQWKLNKKEKSYEFWYIDGAWVLYETPKKVK